MEPKYLLFVALFIATLIAGCLQPPPDNLPIPTGNIVTITQTPEENGGRAYQTFTTSPIIVTIPDQNQIPTVTQSPQRTYVVAVTAMAMPPGCMRGFTNGVCNGVTTTSPTIVIMNQGGQDNENLQFFSVSVNDMNVGEIRPDSGQSSLPVGAVGKFPVTNSNKYHIVVTGHFVGGATQILMDTSL
jgi:hypothetical protein